MNIRIACIYTVLAYIRLVLVGVARGLFVGTYYSAQITQRCTSNRGCGLIEGVV